MRPYRRHSLLILCILALILTGGAAFGRDAAPAPVAPKIMSEGKIRIISELDRAVIRVGDLVDYKLVIEAPKDSKVAMPPPGTQLGNFFIRDYEFPGLEGEKEKSWSEKLGERLKNRAAKKDLVRQEFRFTITAYQTGDLAIPVVPVVVIDPSGVEHKLHTESARVRVVPVTSPEDLTIKDIQAPADVPVPARLYLPWLLLPIALIALAVTAAWKLTRKKPEFIEPPDLRPAHVIAFEELDELEKSDLLKDGQYERFYTRLSLIVRKYLALRFNMYALEYTTHEIAERLKSADLEMADHDRFMSLLRESDLVKFARQEPAVEDRKTAIDRARDVVSRTRIEPAEKERAA